MSVPENLRRDSHYKFVEAARRIGGEVVEFAARSVASRHRHLLGRPMVKHAEKALYHVKAARRIAVKNKATWKESRKHLNKAIYQLDQVEACMDMWFNEACKENVTKLLTRYDDPGRPKGEELENLAKSEKPEDRELAKLIKDENRYIRIVWLIDNERGYIAGVREKEAKLYRSKRSEWEAEKDEKADRKQERLAERIARWLYRMIKGENPGDSL